MLLIGSKALKYNGIDTSYRRMNPIEFDIIGNRNDYEKFRASFNVISEKESKTFPGKFNSSFEYRGRQFIAEFDATDSESNRILLSSMLFTTGEIELFEKKISVLNVPSLYLIKRSHANFPIHFEKTFLDLYNIRKQRELSTEFFSSPYLDMYEARKEEAKKRYGKKSLVNLNKSNEDFFSDNTHRIYDHDTLHEAVAYNYRLPMYLKTKEDINSAMISRSLWDKLDISDKNKMCREEIMVIALERFIIPNKLSEPIEAYQAAYRKLCGTMSTGFFQNYLLDNILNLCLPDVDYVALFRQGISNGIVRKL